MIAKQSGNNCVNRALSTMRLALGYEEGTPEQIVHGEKYPSQILEKVGYWFPEHIVRVMCSKEERQKALSLAENCEYLGDNIPDSFDWDSYLTAFSYKVGKGTESHFVIGVPTLYDNMCSSIVVCVKLGVVT